MRSSRSTRPPGKTTFGDESGGFVGFGGFKNRLRGKLRRCARVVEIQQHRAGAIGAHFARRRGATIGVIDFQPAARRAHRRRAGADAARLPRAAAAVERSMLAPVHEVRRARDPHLRTAERHGAHRPMQRDVVAVDALGQQHDVFVLGGEDDAVSLEGLEVGRRHQRRHHAVPRHGDIGDVVAIVHRRDPRVFDAELFVLAVRQ